MTYFVYLLGNYKNSKLITYVGYTNDLKKRIKLHNTNKGAKFTKGRFWKLLYYETFKTKKNATSREYYLKKNRKMRKLIIKSNIKKIK